jgi:nucleotide-binding universal stress UspA family protein
MGLHHHSKADHFLGTETTIRVMTRAGIPVLAVTKDLSGLPHRVLAAVDFGRASVHMARLATRLIQPPGELILAHVQPPSPPIIAQEDEGLVAVHHHGIEAAFTKLIHDVAPIAGITVKTVVLTGSPGPAILKYADYAKPDVIGVASQRHPLSTRLLLGSVSRYIVRDGRWSMFVTPVA